MTTTTAISPSLYPNVPPPPDCVAPDEWEAGHILSREETRAWRLVYGADRKVTDHDAVAHTRAVQYSDSALESLEIMVYTGDFGLNSDQARELASALLEAAAELDRWAGR